MPTTDDYAKKGITISASTADLDQSNAENLVTTSDKTVINKNSLSTEEVTDRFRHLLLYGRKKVKLHTLFLIFICLFYQTISSYISYSFTIQFHFTIPYESTIETHYINHPQDKQKWSI